MGIRGVLCASQAGLCAALASVCGKLAASSESASHSASVICQWLGVSDDSMELWLYVSIRVLGVVGIFLSNAIMWVQFTKSMHLCSSTLEATSVNTASNFIFTALFGWLLFRDHIGLQWCIGSLLMLVGLTIMHQGAQEKQPEEDSMKLEEDDLTGKLKAKMS